MSASIDISVAGSVDRLAGLMMFWSLVPYLMAVFLATAALLFFSDGSFSPILLLLLLTIVNEGVLKNAIRMDRPAGSCLYGQSYGMPSVSSANARARGAHSEISAARAHATLCSPTGPVTAAFSRRSFRLRARRVRPLPSGIRKRRA